MSWRFWYIYICIILSEYELVSPDIWLKYKCRSLRPIFHGLVIVPWRLFHAWTSLFGTMVQYDQTFDLKRNVCVVSWRLFDVWTSSLGIMGQYDRMFYLKINVCVLYGPLILPYISKTIWWMGVIFSDNEKVWPKPWPQKNIGQHDLYFMVSWFCLISSRVFDRWIS